MNTYQLLVPPPEAFKYGLKGSAMEFRTEEVLEKKYKSRGGKIIDVKYFNEDGNGMLTYHENMDYPTKGIPYSQALVAINGVKAMVILWLLSFNPLTWKRCLNKFIESGHQLIAQHILKPEFMSVRTRTLQELIFNFYGDLKFAEIGSHAFEYDDAYSIILGDIANETSNDLLLKRPIREVLRLGKILMRRKKNLDGAKFKSFIYLLALGLAIPSVRKRFRYSIQTIGIDGLKFDAGDYYWSQFKTFYNFGQ